MKESPTERKQRVVRAIANEQLEGLRVSEESQRLADNYVVGKASAKEAANTIRRRYGITVR